MKYGLVATIIATGALALACGGAAPPPSPVTGLTESGGYSCDDCKIWDVRVVGNKAYLADLKRGLVVLDVTDPANIEELSVLKVQSINALDVSGSHAYIGASQNLTTVDISNPKAPVELAKTRSAGSSYGVDIYGEHLYSGGSVFTLADPASPSKLGDLLKSGSVSGYGNDGSIVVVGMQNQGLSVQDMTDPSNPKELGKAELGYLTEVVVKGGFAYVGEYNKKELKVVDISSPASPKEVSAFSVGGNATALALYEDYLVVGGGRGGITVFDVSAPATPVQKWQAKPSGVQAYKLDANEAGIFVAAREKGLKFIAWQR